MSVEATVEQHYTLGSLAEAIDAGLRAAGVDPQRPTLADLAPVDEFHIGGRAATADLLEQLALPPGSRVLDIGCGLGGASRFLAERGFEVTGIDLTAEYIAVAQSLAERTGLSDRLAYRHGSALDLPFPPASFDAAIMLHVGMNIADKRALFAGIRRVLKDGAALAVYDVMREGDGELAFPVPWASIPATSFVEPLAVYREAIEAAGFAVAATRSRQAFAADFFAAMRARMAESGPPPLGLHIVMGSAAREKVANMVANVGAGLISPTEIIARATAASRP